MARGAVERARGGGCANISARGKDSKNRFFELLLALFRRGVVSVSASADAEKLYRRRLKMPPDEQVALF